MAQHLAHLHLVLDMRLSLEVADIFAAMSLASVFVETWVLYEAPISPMVPF